jgi:hypothetical protein
MSFAARSFAVLACSLAAVSACWSQTSGPRLQPSAPGWNFGTVNQGDEKDYEITITNTGDAPLEVTKVEVTCGCIIAAMEKKALEPAESVALQLHLDARRGGHGQIKKEVILHSNDARNPTVSMHMEGVIKPVWWLPEININLGSMTNGVAQERKIRVYVQEGFDVKLLKVTTNPMEFAVGEINPFKDDTGRGHEIAIKMPLKIESGYFEALVLFESDFKPIPQLACRLFGEFVGAIKISPPQLAFGIMKPGEAKTMKVTVTKTEGTGMSVVRAESKDPAITSKILEREPGKCVEVELTYTAPAAAASFKGQVFITVDEPGHRGHAVEFYGRVAQ